MEDNTKRIWTLAVLAGAVKKEILMFITGLDEDEINKGLLSLSKEGKLIMYALQEQWTTYDDERPEKMHFVYGIPVVYVGRCFKCINSSIYFCRGDEIGKHAALKMLWAQALEGSSPSLGTNTQLVSQ